MPFIKLDHVSVEFPVFNAATRSLKNRILNTVVGASIGKSADGHVIVRGLDDISVTIKDGDRVGLVGHNGAGKTTLLRLLSGIYTPTTGSAAIEGECISLINTTLGIDPEATGRENIRLRAAMMGMTRAEIRERSEEIAEFSGLGEFLDMPFRTYSTGMQLRLAFAASTSISPEILIMDEWLSTGDEDFMEKANRRLSDIVNATNILVLASHSRTLLLENCKRVIWLEHGKFRMDGPAEEVADAYFHRPESASLRPVGGR
jgi:lipopolysaccharide transport system ATP-binding protein